MSREPIKAALAGDRRWFFQALGLALILALLRPLRALLQTRGRKRSDSATRTLGADMPQGLSIHGDTVIRREGDAFAAFSARCPHLGCRIDREEDNELICPCHGSRFAADGSVVRGPAREALTALAVSHFGDQGVLVVD